MDILGILALPATLYVLTLGFGIWLSIRGRPYNGLLFNAHKLIALGAVVLTSVRFYNTLRGTDPAAPPLVLLSVIALCVVALFASGAFMSAGKFSQAAMLAIHRIALGVGLCSLALGAFLLGSGQV